MSMEVCDSGHNEIVYDGGNIFGRNKCPLCEAISQKEAEEKFVKELEDKISDLEDQIAELRSDV